MKTNAQDLTKSPAALIAKCSLEKEIISSLTRCAEMGMSKQDTAKHLNWPYITVWKRCKRFELEELFEETQTALRKKAAIQYHKERKRVDKDFRCGII